MTLEKKTLGRPKGSGIDDMPTLRGMAELIAVQPELKPTTAFKRVYAKWLDKDIRRIQIKWKKGGAELIAEVTSRPRNVSNYAASPATAVMADAVAQLTKGLEMMERLAGLGNSMQASSRHFQEIANAHSALEACISPATRLANAYHDSPAARLAREIHDSPSARLARQFYDSPSARLAREMYNSPEMRLMREVRLAMPGGWLK